MTACSFAVSAHACWNWAARAARTAIPRFIPGHTWSTCRSLDMRRRGFIRRIFETEYVPSVQVFATAAARSPVCCSGPVRSIGAESWNPTLRKERAWMGHPFLVEGDNSKTRNPGHPPNPFCLSLSNRFHNARVVPCHRIVGLFTFCACSCVAAYYHLLLFRRGNRKMEAPE